MKKAIAVLGLVTTVLCCGAFFVPKKHNKQLSFQGVPTTEAQLGEMLFFENKLSADGTLSCASCHLPDHAFADTAPVSKGVHGALGRRNTPSCMNLADRPLLFYDGRARSLEDQVHFPVEDKNEMAIPFAKAVQRIQKDERYQQHFQKVYGQLPSGDKIQAAIAAFERSLETSHTPFDRYMADDSLAISTAAIRGRELFMGKKAKCFDCHFSPDFTGDEFRNIGLFNGNELNDSGRYEVTKNKGDIGKFRVPGLRNVAVTAPYMHNGMFKTLKEVIDYYDNPYSTVAHPVNIDTLLLQPLGLTPSEKRDLEQFLLTLTDDRFATKRNR